MVNLRLYRAAFAPFLAVVIVLLFSLPGVPEGVRPPDAPLAFDGNEAAQMTRQIVRTAPVRTPGSAGDSAVADLVAKQFRSIRAGEFSEQAYDSSFEGDDVQLRNVLLTLPGTSDATIALIAARDSARGPGAASSAAATASLLELAGDLGASTHSKTLLFASTDGGSDGATGVRELAEHYPDAGKIEAAVVLWQPGSAVPGKPSVLSTSTDDGSTSIQLERTLEQALTEQTDEAPEHEGALGQLARLAVPTGLGEQAPLIGEGVDAVAISSAGERPLAPTADQPENVSPEALGTDGRAALSTILAVDGALEPLEHGPGAYVVLGDNLVPGWGLSLIALTLVLPALAAGIDGTARAARGGARPSRAVAWTASLVLAPLAALILLYVLALVGIVPRPRFPFDPGRFTVGFGEVLAMSWLGVVMLFTWYELRAWERPANLSRAATLPAIGLVGSAAVLWIWLFNPYLALLLVGLAHAWLVCAREPRGIDPPLAAIALAAALAPAIASTIYVSGQLNLGASAPWTFLLMLADWQVSPPVALGLSALTGSGLALLVVAGGEGWKRRTGPLDASPIGSTRANTDVQTGAQASKGRP